MRSRLAVILFALAAGCAAPKPVSRRPLEGVQLAVTVDDLPAHGDDIPGLSRQTIAQEVLAALKGADVPQVYGFCNKAWPDDASVLDLWKAAGYPLGNHTLEHPDLEKVGSEAFIENIAKEDAELKDVSPLPARRTFRYPYLHEGPTKSEHEAVRRYLSAHGYRVAEVTVDYHDWAWTDAYARCLGRRDVKTIDWMRQHVVTAALQSLRDSRQRAKEVVGRDVKQILLIHIGAFDGVMLKDVLAAYKAAGVSFITLDEALTDPIYASDPDVPVTQDAPGMYLEQLSRAKGMPRRYFPTEYSDEKLTSLCAPQG